MKQEKKIIKIEGEISFSDNGHCLGAINKFSP